MELKTFTLKSLVLPLMQFTRENSYQPNGINIYCKFIQCKNLNLIIELLNFWKLNVNSFIFSYKIKNKKYSNLFLFFFWFCVHVYGGVCVSLL